eukprot:TRINITY_DN7935_c0_g1_i1.p1 TRINITY_DN7935_c0_g1~~TRINITY_DN7935_c0_g1_i1.p1  ORF type:complete len:241 (-),score=24.46 TRINITY_DN7935_c0_g1_i1:17-739(-)
MRRALRVSRLCVFAGRRYLSTQKTPRQKKVALVLSGCGVNDGSEIHEATSFLIHLSAQNAEVECFAPDVLLTAIDHITGEEQGIQRDVLIESARISRGQITDLAQFNANKFDALCFPGGYGAAKNLCSFAFDGTNCTINTDVERAIQSFHNLKKPIAFACISPVLAALSIKGCTLTIGNNSDVAAALEALGAKHIQQPVDGVCFDKKNLVYSTPAYMLDEPIHKVHQGIGNMIQRVLASL